MDPFMDVLKNYEEPEWLERTIVGEIRLWQIMFLCIACMTTLIVMVCCCFRFRIPRTKQQIEADYQRRKITCKFRQQLETIQDAKMDDMSLKDGRDAEECNSIDTFTSLAKHDIVAVHFADTKALDLLHVQSSPQMENQPESQPSSIVSPQQSSLDASFQPEGGQKPEPQVSGLSFVKFASKVATLSKLSAPKSPTSPTPSGNKMDF